MNNLVTLNNGVASTTSLIIAEQFGRKHSHVIRSIEKVIGRYGIVPTSYLDATNHAYKMYELPEREALIVMPFIGGQKSIDGQERLVDAFLAIRNHVVKSTTTDQRLDRLEAELSSLKNTHKPRIPTHKPVINHIETALNRVYDFTVLGTNRMTATQIYRLLDLGIPTQKDFNFMAAYLVGIGITKTIGRGVTIYKMP
jgi:phage regulator Rha-like protein